MTNAIAKAREQQVFVVPETTKGTLVGPAAAYYVIAAGIASMDQTPTFTNSEEISNSRDITDRFADRMPPGTFSIPCYVRPSGSAGTAPQEKELLKSLLGVETVVGSTSVTYGLQMTKPSVSVWIKKGHTVLFGSGAVVGTAGIGLSPSGAAMWTFGGQLMKMGKVGTDTIDGSLTTAATAVTVDDVKKFDVGGFIEFVESDVVKNNTDAGYQITDITGSVLTITPGVEEDIDDGSVIRPWLPTGTEVGEPLASRLGKANIAAADVSVREMQIDITDEPEFMVDEITSTQYITDYVEKQRSISGRLNIVFRQDDVSYIDDGINGVQKDIKMIIGTAAGSIMTINLPYGVIDAPSIQDIDPKVALDMTLTGLGSTGEDSITIAYT